MPVDVVDEKPALHQLQRVPRQQIAKKLGNMLVPLSALLRALSATPGSALQERSASTLVQTQAGGTFRTEEHVRISVAKCLEDVHELEQSARGLRTKVNQQGEECLTDWAILAKSRDLCALIRKCFDSNDFEALSGSVSGAAGEYWNQSLNAASDVLSLLEKARPRIIFADGAEDEQLSGSDLSFFPTVDGFSETGSHNSQRPTVVTNPTSGQRGPDDPQGSLVSGFTLDEVMSSSGQFSPEDRYAIGRGINALFPESAFNSVYDLAPGRVSVAPSVATTVGGSTMSVAMTDLLKNVSQKLIGDAAFGGPLF